MNIIPTLSTADIYNFIILIGALAVGYFVVRRTDISNIKSQLEDARKDNDELRKRLDDKDKENKDFQSQINGLTVQMESLKHLLDEKDKRIDALQKVQISLAPEMVSYMQDVRNFMNQTHTWMINTTEVLTKLNQRSISRQIK